MKRPPTRIFCIHSLDSGNPLHPLDEWESNP